MQVVAVDILKNEAAAALAPETRRWHQAILTAFAERGTPPARAGLPGEAVAELVDRDLIGVGPDGEIRYAYPFSAEPTAHHVAVGDGPVVYAMCAVDALGISTMIGRPVVIESEEPGAGRTITVRVDGGRAEWEPETAVVFAGCIAGGTTSADRTCGHINFFATREAATRHATVPGSILDQREALASAVTEFGPLLESV